MEVTRPYLYERKASLLDGIAQLRGALDMVDELLALLDREEEAVEVAET